jgi:hypothetical protein
MIRARLFHDWILKWANERETGHSEPVWFQLPELSRFMPFGIYLKCFGLSASSSVIDEYLKLEGERAQQMQLQHLPDNIKKHMPKLFKFRSQTVLMLEFLTVLGPLTMRLKESNGSDKVIHEYSLSRKVNLYDYRQENMPLLQIVNLNTQSDLKNYWAQLELMCNEGFLRKVDGQPNSELPHVAAMANHVQSLFISRNWVATFPYTIEQRKVLESFVNRDEGLTPLNNENIIQEISRTLNLAPINVRNYFSRVEYQLHHQVIRLEENRRRRRANQGITKNEAVDGENQTQETENVESAKQAVEREKSRKIVRDVMRRNRNLQDQKVDASIVPTDESSAPKQRKTRSYWVEEEDTLLRFAYAIMTSICAIRGIRYSMKPITTIIKRNRTVCGRRISGLLKMPANYEKHRFLVSRWPAAWDEGIKSGKLSDFTGTDSSTVDLMPYVTYFQSFNPLERQ